MPCVQRVEPFLYPMKPHPAPLHWLALPVATLGGVVSLLLATGAETLRPMLRGRRPFRWRLFLVEVDRAGPGSLPLVMLVSFFLGVTMALLTGEELRRYGTENLVPGLIGVAFTRELGPLITGIMVAARIGAAYTAELGTMTVSEEVEAVEAMGIGPRRLLVAPRLLAVGVALPCLSVMSSVAALAGGALVCHHRAGFAYTYFLSQLNAHLVPRDLVAGEAKSLLFGLIIGGLACYKGLTVRGGAAGVGAATTASVVLSVASVIGADMVCNLLLSLLHAPRF